MLYKLGRKKNYEKRFIKLGISSIAYIYIKESFYFKIFSVQPKSHKRKLIDLFNIRRAAFQMYCEQIFFPKYEQAKKMALDY